MLQATLSLEPLQGLASRRQQGRIGRGSSCAQKKQQAGPQEEVASRNDGEDRLISSDPLEEADPKRIWRSLNPNGVDIVMLG